MSELRRCPGCDEPEGYEHRPDCLVLKRSELAHQFELERQLFRGERLSEVNAEAVDLLEQARSALTSNLRVMKGRTPFVEMQRNTAQVTIERINEFLKRRYGRIE